MSSPAFSPMSLAEAVEENLYGGKCVSLGAALRANLPVPKGYALPVQLVHAIANGDEAAISAVLPLFPELGSAVAVRSSAVGEDSAAASFAGQHLSVLNVMAAPAMVAAIASVHRSAFTEEAIAYRERMAVPGEPSIAVAVQQQILSEVAGVMFTRNPITGASERYIEASWGLGEAVVAGMVVPDSFRVSADGEQLEAVAGEKDVELVARSDGETEEREVDSQRISAFCLKANELGRLHDLALKCEAVYGEHLDIEWAFYAGQLYLLQCRAITI